MTPHEKTRRREPWEREGHPFDDGYGYDDPDKLEAMMMIAVHKMDAFPRW